MEPEEPFKAALRSYKFSFYYDLPFRTNSDCSGIGHPENLCPRNPTLLLTASQNYVFAESFMEKMGWGYLKLPRAIGRSPAS